MTSHKKEDVLMLFKDKQNLKLLQNRFNNPFKVSSKHLQFRSSNLRKVNHIYEALKAYADKDTFYRNLNFYSISDLEDLIHDYTFSAINALDDYYNSSKSIAEIAKQNRFSLSAVERLRNNPRIINIYNYLFHKHAYIGEGRKKNYRQYNYGLKNLIGDSNYLQNTQLCKYYNQQLRAIQHIPLLSQIISICLEHHSDNRHLKLKTHDLMMVSQNNRQDVLNFLSDKLFISNRNGHRSRIVYYRNPDFPNLKSIKKGNQIVNENDINEFGLKSHQKWILESKIFKRRF